MFRGRGYVTDLGPGWVAKERNVNQRQAHVKEVQKNPKCNASQEKKERKK